jgi:hypothetical protein
VILIKKNLTNGDGATAFSKCRVAQLGLVRLAQWTATEINGESREV